MARCGASRASSTLTSAVHEETFRMHLMCLGARLAGLCLLATLPGAHAVAQQAPASTLRGTIQDQTGAVVPGVRVTIADATGAVRGETTTDAAGAFVFQGIAAGTYDIRTAFEGFQPAAVHIRVGAGRAVSLPKIVLQLASI